MSKHIGLGIIALLFLSLAGDEARSQGFGGARGGGGRPAVVGGYPAGPAPAVARPAPVVRPAAVGGVVVRNPAPVARAPLVGIRGAPVALATDGGHGMMVARR